MFYSPAVVTSGRLLKMSPAIGSLSKEGTFFNVTRPQKPSKRYFPKRRLRKFPEPYKGYYTVYLCPCSALMCFSILDLNLNGWRQCWHRYFPSTPLCCVEKIPSPDRSSFDFLLLMTPGWGKAQSLNHISVSFFLNWQNRLLACRRKISSTLAFNLLWWL